MANEVQFSVKSMVDDFGRVFIKDGRIFRAIRAEKKTYCLELLQSPLFKELNEKGLVPVTTVTDEQVTGYALVLEHEKLTETLQHEWSFGMLKDAALAVLETNAICEKYGYELKDAHTLNVLFRGSQPVMVDLGSIDKKTAAGEWSAYEEFLASFVIPLLFWSRNEIYITRKLLESNFHRMTTIPSQHFLESGLADLLPLFSRKYNFSIRGNGMFSTSSYSRTAAFIAGKTKRLIKITTGKDASLFSYEKKHLLSGYLPYQGISALIKGLPSPTLGSTWQGYHSKFYSDNGKITYSPRFMKILDLIRGKSGEINSVIDLAGNEGYVCFLLKQELGLKKVTLVDYDENAVEAAYQTARKQKFTDVYTVLMNMMFTPDLNGTSNRLRSDLAIALAVTHHLLLTGKYALPAIFERLRMFSGKYVMIEFMPLGLWAIGETTYPVNPSWYTEEWFKAEFEKHFTLLHHEKLEENRIVFFGEIINKSS